MSMLSPGAICSSTNKTIPRESLKSGEDQCLECTTSIAMAPFRWVHTRTVKRLRKTLNNCMAAHVSSWAVIPPRVVVLTKKARIPIGSQTRPFLRQPQNGRRTSKCKLRRPISRSLIVSVCGDNSAKNRKEGVL